MSFKQKVSTIMLVVFSFTLLSVNLVLYSTKSIAQEIIVTDVGPEFNKELECLAQNIYWEAASESYEGKLAVAQVTLNRVNSGKFPSTICGVVKQKDRINGLIVCQFSWFCNAAHSMIRNKYQWEESQMVARKALTESTAHDILEQKKAMYYHAVYINPGWKLPVITRIGNHIFYSERKF